MAKGCKKCDPHELCEECPEWIFTLADLIMCMMGLFVLLWCLKKEGAEAAAAASPASVQEAMAKAEADFTENFRQGFITPLDMPTSSGTDNPQKQDAGEKGPAKNRPETPDGQERSSQLIRPGQQSATGGRLLFARGSDQLTDKAKQQLEQVVDIIKGHRNIVLVKGHTSLDDLRESATAEDKMSLSVRRAKTVQDYLISRGVAPEVLRVVGCSTFEPVVQRVNQLMHSQNRRVEVESTPTLVRDLQDPQPDTPALDER
jgi:outer membrane protein OmpA-like peptidoglycan-associated protein